MKTIYFIHILSHFSVYLNSLFAFTFGFAFGAYSIGAHISVTFKTQNSWRIQEKNTSLSSSSSSNDTLLQQL